MGYTEDLARARRMREHLQTFDVKVSIELQAGAGGSWSNNTMRFLTKHHVASYPSQGNTPFLNLVKKGRGGSLPVPGPLANGYGGYDEIYRIITFGRANHPGKGGPWTAGGYRIPKDNGRYYMWGDEFEGGYLDYTPSMRSFMARVAAGQASYFAEYWGYPDALTYLDFLLEHKDWAPGRKFDRKGYTRTVSIAETRAVLLDARGGGALTPTTSEEDDDMPVLIKDPKRDQQWITNWIVKHPIDDRKVSKEMQSKGVKLIEVAQYTIDRIPTLDSLTAPARVAAAQTAGIHRGGKEISLRQEVADSKTMLIELEGVTAGLLTALADVSTGRDVDLDAVKNAAREGVADALASVEADVTLTIGTEN